MKNNLIKTIAQALNLKHHFVENTINLLDEDASVPFIARYRKDNTGGLNETQILSIKEMLEQIKELEKRKKYILKAIDEQGKLNKEVCNQSLDIFESQKSLSTYCY